MMLACLTIKSQNPVPNSSFENWSNGSPTSWSTNNISGMAVPITQSSDSHTGNSAVKLEAVNAIGIVYLPGLNSANDFTVNTDYAGYSFYYKCNLTSKDQLLTQGTLKQGSTTKAGAQAIITSLHNTSVYTQTTATFIYITPGADKASLTFGLIPTSGNTVQVGSYVIIDDVAMVSSVPTELNELNNEVNFKIGGSFPNPASGFSLIPFSLGSACHVSITLYNLEGKKILDVLNEDLNKGRYKAEFDATTVQSGMYICKLNANGFESYSKILVK